MRAALSLSPIMLLAGAFMFHGSVEAIPHKRYQSPSVPSFRPAFGVPSSVISATESSNPTLATTTETST
ncbi:hypothetical protein HK102_007217, partial [Quaeritorhiza haematococci]